MMEAHENDLVEFFGVLPTTGSAEEDEFFGTTTFDVERGDFHLKLAVSQTHRGLSLSLDDTPSGHRLISLNMSGLTDMKIENVADGGSELICRAVGRERTPTTEQKESFVQEVMIRVDPVISLRVRTKIDEDD